MDHPFAVVQLFFCSVKFHIPTYSPIFLSFSFLLDTHKKGRPRGGTGGTFAVVVFRVEGGGVIKQCVVSEDTM